MRVLRYLAHIVPVDPSEKPFFAPVRYFITYGDENINMVVLDNGDKYKDDMYGITIKEWIGIVDRHNKDIYDGDDILFEFDKFEDLVGITKGTIRYSTEKAAYVIDAIITPGLTKEYAIDEGHSSNSYVLIERKA